MGFRFRKSKKIGGGFRVNFSKSGIGGSWGVKGFRVTKRAKGGFRTTMSIPGTGISYSTGGKGASGGCLTVLLFPLKLVFWMIYGVIYGIIWLFILLIKGIIKLFKVISKRKRDSTITNNLEKASNDGNVNETQTNIFQNVNNNSKIELLLCIFLGWLGIHKFYRKKTALGILYVFTLGILGIGWILDTVLLFVNLIKTDSNKG